MENKALCRKISSMLSLYIDNKVTYQQRAFIEDHLSNCPECYKKFLYLKSLIKDLKDSYKQVLELAVKKQKQHTFNIREHEKFIENLSPYVDNELDAQECFEFRKYLIKSKNAQKELKNIYIIQKEMRNSFDKTKKDPKADISKVVIESLREKQESLKINNVINVLFTPKTVKIAILAGLVLIGGYEFEQLYSQHKTAETDKQQIEQLQNKPVVETVSLPKQVKKLIRKSEAQ